MIEGRGGCINRSEGWLGGWAGGKGWLGEMIRGKTVQEAWLAQLSQRFSSGSGSEKVRLT